MKAQLKDLIKMQGRRLIDNLIQDCQQLGITTGTPDEIAKIKSLWAEAKKRENRNELKF